MVRIDSFDALLTAAREESEQQRFLLVFVKTVLPDDADEDQVKRFQSGFGGGLMPVMYVDKAEDDIVDFASLVEESRHMSETWNIVLVGCLSGRNGHAPTSADAEEPLKNMVRTIHAGGSLTQFATFDRQGSPVRFE